MKAYRLRSGANIEGLEAFELKRRELKAHEARLRVHAVSLYRDLMVARGQYPHTNDGPQIPTSDAAVEVIAVGGEVRRFEVDDRAATTFFPNWLDGAASPRRRRTRPAATWTAFSPKRRTCTSRHSCTCRASRASTKRRP